MHVGNEQYASLVMLSPDKRHRIIRGCRGDNEGGVGLH